MLTLREGLKSAPWMDELSVLKADRLSRNEKAATVRTPQNTSTALPPVSIITPSLNMVEFIEETISSVTSSFHFRCACQRGKGAVAEITSKMVSKDDLST